MANGKFERGEMYWFKFGDTTGSEMAAGRPGVIVSCNKGNETAPTLMIAMVTRQAKYMPIDVKTMVGGFPRWILCNQIQTVDKSRASNFIGALSQEELEALDTALEDVFDLGYADETKDKEIDLVNARLEESEATISSMKMEIEMWKKCYDRAMDMLVDVKINADYSLRTARESKVEQPVVVKQPEPPKEPERIINTEEKAEEPERVEVNTCSAEELKRCGCSPVVVENIINSRPYTNIDELRVVQGVTSVAYGLLKHKLCCVPVKVEEPEQKTEESEVVVEAEEQKPAVLEKVNINTATIKEMMEHLSIGQYYASKISSHRNKNGKFVSVEELKLVEGLAKDFFERYGDRCTIGEPVEELPEEPTNEEEQTEPGKVNINTATAHEIHDVSGMHINYCYSICGHRKRNGLFTSLEELLSVKLITPGVYNKYKDYFILADEEPEKQEPKSDKVNVNTASLRDLMEVGFEKRAAALIVNERKKFGRFRTVDDLSEIPEISGKILRKLRDKLEV